MQKHARKKNKMADKNKMAEKPTSLPKVTDSLRSFFLLPSISLPTRITETSSTLIDNIYFTPTKYKATSGNLLYGIRPPTTNLDF